MTDLSSSPYAHAPLEVAQAFVDGRTASEAPTPGKATCPYAEGSNEHGAWHRGYRFGEMERSAAN